MRSQIDKVRRDERGVVSLFIVIFSTLLLTVLTIGFVRIMIKEQQQAMNDDLSQSAYDSATAGVEDGKRVIRKCLDGDAHACDVMSAKRCTTVSDAGVVALVGGETTIKSNSATEADSLNQAYTCVKIDMNTDDYYTSLTKGQSRMIPLNAVGPFTRIQIQWMHKGLQGQAESGTLQSPTSAALGYDALPKEADWNTSAASLLRAQTILPVAVAGASIAQTDFDTSTVSTAFLKPANVVGGAAPNPHFVIGTPRASTDAGASTSPNLVGCSKDEYAAGGLTSGYACIATLQWSNAVPAGSTLAYLRLTSLYRDTSVRIQLFNDAGATVQLNGVQPQIDSTGRASNVFRRVMSRVDVSTNAPTYPEYAVDTTGSLCKDFYVTANKGGEGAGASCTTTP